MSPQLAAWENFYIVVGTSGGALTGLVFVVITLSAGRQTPSVRWATGAFTTPTVVHFGAVLLVAALLSAPWPEITPAALLLGLAALAGMAYCAFVARRIRRRIGYEPVWEDWLWFVILPLGAYTVLLVAAILLLYTPVQALFGIGAVLVLLLIIGIRNAWDLVTYSALALGSSPQTQQNQQDEHAAGDERVES
jgi:hypothetical protein